MRVLVIGGTGFIGEETAGGARDAGHDVTIVHRDTTARDLGLSVIHADANALSASGDALRAARADVVVHCVCSTERAADEALDVFRGTRTQLIVLSSQDCYEAFQHLNHDRDAYDLPIRESSPTSAARYYWRDIHPSRDRDYDKNLMTERVMVADRAGDIAATVFRLPMVYGPRDRQFAFRHGPILRRIVDGRARMVMGSAAQCRVFTYGYVENVAAAVVHAFGRADVRGCIENLGEATVRTARRWADLYATAAGVVFDHVALPDEMVARDASARDRASPHFIVDCSRYAARTAFVDPVPLETAIARTLAWARAHVDALGERPDYEAEDRMIAAHASFMDGIHRERNAG